MVNMTLIEREATNQRHKKEQKKKVQKEKKGKQRGRKRDPDYIQG